MGAILPRFTEYVSQVFAHPVHRKAVVEFAFQHGFRAVVHLPRLGRALGDHLDDAAGVERVVLVGEGDAPHDLRYEDLVAAGIIDAAKVTRSALQNAASIATMMLTTDTLVTDLPERKSLAPAGGHDYDDY